MPELVLYGIRLLAKQLLGTFLDMEVDQSGHRTAGRFPCLATLHLEVPLVRASHTLTTRLVWGDFQSGPFYKAFWTFLWLLGFFIYMIIP